MGKRRRSSSAIRKRGASRGDGEEATHAATHPPPKGRGRSPGHGVEGRWPPATGKRLLTPPLARRRREEGTCQPRGRGALAASDGEEASHAAARPLPTGKKVLADHGEEGARAR